jgi:hypothetical protein
MGIIGQINFNSVADLLIMKFKVKVRKKVKIILSQEPITRVRKLKGYFIGQKNPILLNMRVALTMMETLKAKVYLQIFRKVMAKRKRRVYRRLCKWL